jgi:CO/xanthine dehydrogenase Mo-binding subunit
VTVVGDPLDRVDGPYKVTGTAAYPSDVSVPGLAHAALVRSTIAAGRVRAISAARAMAEPGVLAVIDHTNVPSLAEVPMTPLGQPPRWPLTDDQVLHHGQIVAMVVAETLESAVRAAALVEVDYERATPILDIDDPDAPVLDNPFGLASSRGDAAAALASAEVTYDQTFTTAPETNNPMGLFATVAEWHGDHLTVHDSTQWPVMARHVLASVFGVPEAHVRVRVPFIGGGFGAGLRTWPHTVMTAMAARVLERPVKLVLTRPEMFTAIGHRAYARQRIQLGATRDGVLVAIDHEVTSTVSMAESNVQVIALAVPNAYACPNVAVHDRQVRLNIPNPGWLRGPGKSEGNFALESALDELAYATGVDPVEVRLRNYTDANPVTGLPWSSTALRECLVTGADQFGWYARNPAPRSMRAGNELIGYGMAGVTYEWGQAPCEASLTLTRDGAAILRSAATDLGTGTYTVATQLTAELLGLEPGQVRVEIGDSDLPTAPQSGGSGLTASLASAIGEAVRSLAGALLALVTPDSPLSGLAVGDVSFTSGRIHLTKDPAQGHALSELVQRHSGPLTVHAYAAPSTDGITVAPAGAFAAQYVEVRIDEDLGILRVHRLLSVIDGGRILNAKTARSQITGATVMGIGMAMFEETLFEPETGRIANATFGDYLIPVNADIPNLDVIFVGEPDTLHPLGVKGIGEVGCIGIAAAIANAVYHATGRRIRDLPITIEKLL